VSSVLYFGEPWDAPLVDDATAVATPVGQVCYACGEQVAAGDRGLIRQVVRMMDGSPAGSVEPVHAECDLRAAMGHQVGVCPCTGYGHDRVAGRLVWQRVFGVRERSG
jgi:hypothetical protein